MTPARPYIESHSALRGIAALTVLMDHLRAFEFLPQRGLAGRCCQIFAWNDLAVFLFFILSGFVMSYVYPSPVRWKHFLVARLARLAPVYEVTLLVALVLTPIILDQAKITGFNLAANVVMIQQWLPVRDWFSINFPSWSLSVEALLYVAAFPLLVWSRTRVSKDAFYMLLIVAGAVWGTIYYNHYRPTFFHHWQLPILAGLFGFGAGFALHGLMTEGGLRHPRIVAGAGLGLIAASVGYRILFPATGSHAFLMFGLILIVVSSVDRAGWTSRMLARPALIYLGDISYSLYLWHLPLLMILIYGRGRVENFVHGTWALLGFHLLLGGAAFGLCFGVATVSYYQLEVPFRRLIRDRFVRPHAGAVV
jgi:peptidoglycan/LPS O-acetylase OafA/YrhL